MKYQTEGTRNDYKQRIFLDNPTAFVLVFFHFNSNQSFNTVLLLIVVCLSLSIYLID
jgi:hypothetical protein